MSNASKVVLAAGAAAAAVGSWFLVSTSGGKPFLAPVYEAVRVIDGDTFTLSKLLLANNYSFAGIGFIKKLNTERE